MLRGSWEQIGKKIIILDHLRKHCAYNLPPELNSLGTAQIHPTSFSLPILLTNFVFDYFSGDRVSLSLCSPCLSSLVTV